MNKLTGGLLAFSIALIAGLAITIFVIVAREPEAPKSALKAKPVAAQPRDTDLAAAVNPEPERATVEPSAAIAPEARPPKTPVTEAPKPQARSEPDALSIVKKHLLDHLDDADSLQIAGYSRARNTEILDRARSGIPHPIIPSDPSSYRPWAVYRPATVIRIVYRCKNEFGAMKLHDELFAICDGHVQQVEEATRIGINILFQEHWASEVDQYPTEP